jgi:hypothetical protein
MQTIPLAQTILTHNDSSDTLQLLVGLSWPFVQQFLKDSSWFSFLQNDTDRRNLIASFAFALAATLVIHYNMLGSGPPLTINLQLAGHFLGQGLIQHVTYQSAIKRDAQAKKALTLLHKIHEDEPGQTSRAHRTTSA